MENNSVPMDTSEIPKVVEDPQNTKETTFSTNAKPENKKRNGKQRKRSNSHSPRRTPSPSRKEVSLQSFFRKDISDGFYLSI